MIALYLLACHAPQPRTGNGGVGLGLFADTPTYDYGDLVAEIADTGASGVLLAVPWSLPDVQSHALRSPVPRSVVKRVMAQARSRRLAITVMPIIVLEARGPGDWRGTLQPTEPELFWSNYDALTQTLAIDAQQGGAVRFVVGSELNSLEHADWPSRIDRVRQVFDGSVTYSANWDRYSDLPFWSAVDEVTATAYFAVDGPETWPTELERLHAFADAHGKPLVLSEYGYPAISTAAERPWDETAVGTYAPQLQADLIGDALQALAEQPPAAHFLWNWFGTGAANEASFTPRHRPAAAVLRQALRTPEANR